MRVTYGQISLEAPDGFRDQSTLQWVRDAKIEDNKPVAGQYPMSVTLNRDKVGEAPDPLLYLKSKLAQLKPQLADYREEVCEKTEVGRYRAARAQFTFVAEFQLTQLVLVWFAGDDVLTGVTTTTQPGVREGWSILSALAPTVQIA